MAVILLIVPTLSTFNSTTSLSEITVPLMYAESVVSIPISAPKPVFGLEEACAPARRSLDEGGDRVQRWYQYVGAARPACRPAGRQGSAVAVFPFEGNFFQIVLSKLVWQIELDKVGLNVVQEIPGVVFLLPVGIIRFFAISISSQNVLRLIRFAFVLPFRVTSQDLRHRNTRHFL